MKAIDDLIVRLRGELSSRIDDRDIVDILEVLQEAQGQIDRFKETNRSLRIMIEKGITFEDLHNPDDEINPHSR